MRSRALASAALGALLLSGGARSATVEATRLGEWRSGMPFGTGGAEIVAIQPAGMGGSPALVAWIVNGAAKALDQVSLADPSTPLLLRRIPLSTLAGRGSDGPTSVAVDPLGRGVAVALPDVARQAPGRVAFLDLEGDLVSLVEVGALPDMLVFTPDGSRVLVANEGEPSDDYATDPEGSVSLIDVRGGFLSPVVITARIEGIAETGPVRHFGPNAARPELDFEPEYIAVSADGSRAWVALQEANAIAELDVTAGAFTRVHGLGFKDHSLPGQGLDPSADDGAIAIAPHPVLGMYQPDGIALLETGGRRLLLTANEGDSRDYFRFSESRNVEDVAIEAPLTRDLQDIRILGGLEMTVTLGDPDGDFRFEQIHAFGARSMSIWDVTDGLSLLADTGDDIERSTADVLPDHFNSAHDSNATFDDRSNDKGPEPEAVVHGVVCGRRHAFVGLERISGVIAFDIEDPGAPEVSGFFISRRFDVFVEDSAAGGLGPEGLAFVPGPRSPTGEPLLLVAHEMSGTMDVWELSDPSCPGVSPEDCGNGVDDDGDVLIDCADPDCRIADGDGDGVPDCIDCAPLDASAIAAPPAQVLLTATRVGPGGARLWWDDGRAVAGDGTRARIPSGPVSRLRPDGGLGAGACLATGVMPPLDDARGSASSDGWWYLVRLENACGTGSWGADSSGVPRSLPCP